MRLGRFAKEPDMSVNTVVKGYLLRIAAATHESANTRLNAIELLEDMWCKERTWFCDKDLRDMCDTCMTILKAEHEDSDDRVRAGKFVLHFGGHGVTVDRLKALPKEELDALEQRLRGLMGDGHS